MPASLQTIKGIGEKRAEALGRLGVMTVEALLNYLPRDYYDYSRAVPVTALTDGQAAAVQVRINSAPKFFRKGGMTVLSAQASDETGSITLRWFNQPYMRMKIIAGSTIYACGRVSKKKGASLVNPSLADSLPGIVPVYPTVHGVSQRTIRDAVFASLRAHWTQIGETLPLTVLSRYGLCTRQLALRHAHFPASMRLLEIARNRLSFEDLLCYLLMVEAERRERARSIGIAFRTDGVSKRYIALSAFPPTKAQRNVMEEIRRDMCAPVPMNRLLQGDVGSGKTFVALYAMSVAVANGYQGALLVPTEILAEQHFSDAQALFGDTAVLLTGNMKASAREEALLRISTGEAKCVIGTHALLQPGVRFHKLGLVITDEQHRFGVQQRAEMQEKGVRPDVLVMSATPIPRTLALLLFGDLDISVLDEMPPGRMPVKTAVIPPEKRNDMLRYVASEAAKGVQTYIVCPMIAENEGIDAPSVDDVYASITRAMPDVPAGKLHGRMKEADKQTVMRRFREGETKVLVTTTVIEVGVHVAAANIMIIEGADRFGLSQLHQLRGRVGRGKEQAYCFLLSDSGSDTAMERMRIIAESCDGFAIAEQDLALRGPGDFLGLRQHGDGTARLLGAAMDLPMMQTVRQAAHDIMEIPNEENNALLLYARSRYAQILGQIAMN